MGGGGKKKQKTKTKQKWQLCEGAFCGVHPYVTKGAFHIPVTPHIYLFPLLKVSSDAAREWEENMIGWSREKP